MLKKYKAQKDEITALDPASQDLAEAYAAVVGILLKQDGVGYHKPFYQKNIAKKNLNGIEIDIGRPLSEIETKAIAEAIAAESGNTEYNPIASPRGARILNFDYVGIDNIKFMSIVKRALDGVQFDNNESYIAGQFAANTGYLGNNWEVDKNGGRVPSKYWTNFTPIFKEGLKVSSGKSNREFKKLIKTSQSDMDGQEMNPSTPTTDSDQKT